MLSYERITGHTERSSRVAAGEIRLELGHRYGGQPFSTNLIQFARTKSTNMMDSRFKPGASGCPEKQFKKGNPHRWPRGVSGNPTGLSKTRQEFERIFNQALIEDGSPEEAAQLLWAAARKGEPWAIQALCQRFAPETHSLRILQEENDEKIDYSKLTDEELEQLDALVQRASDRAAIDQGGESPSQPL